MMFCQVCLLCLFFVFSQSVTVDDKRPSVLNRAKPFVFVLKPPKKISWVRWRGGIPKTMCPRTNVLGSLVPKLIVPCDKMSLDWYTSPCHYAFYTTFFWLGQISRDVSVLGHCFFSRDKSPRGPGVPEHSYRDTSFSGCPPPSPHHFHEGVSPRAID